MLGLGFLILRLLFIYIFHLNIVLFGDKQYRLYIREVFLLHDKGDGIISTTTTEAMVEIRR